MTKLSAGDSGRRWSGRSVGGLVRVEGAVGAEEAGRVDDGSDGRQRVDDLTTLALISSPFSSHNGAHNALPPSLHGLLGHLPTFIFGLATGAIRRRRATGVWLERLGCRGRAGAVGVVVVIRSWSCPLVYKAERFSA